MFDMNLEERLNLIRRAVHELEENIKKLQAEFEELEKAERVNATEYWREGVYLYLIYPMQDGSRRREYIGADVGKIKEALQKVNNHRRYEDLKREIEYQKLSLYEVQTYLDSILWKLKGIQLPLWKELAS